MAVQDFKSSYKTIMDDHFQETMEITFKSSGQKQTLVYEKVSWLIDGINKGLRYGENPGQEAALYKLVNGNLSLGNVTTIQPGNYLASDIELLQSGKHPGKTNITDADNALNILRYFPQTPCCVIVKHNNPCGVAKGNTLAESYTRAYTADRIAAFGGAIAFNREVDLETAALVNEEYAEVVVAPEFAPGVMELFAKKKNLRVMRINNIDRLKDFVGVTYVDFKSLIDGGIIVQSSFVPITLNKTQMTPAQAEYKGKEYSINRLPTEKEYDDLLFGWLIETAVTSNSVIYVKDGVTTGIGTGEQDRVGVAVIARDKAYRNYAEAVSWTKFKKSYSTITDPDMKKEIDSVVRADNGGIKGSCMVSDAFFPFRDGIDVGIREGITAVIQPGGAIRDHESIEACNESNTAMVFTGQRCFKH